ncbi:hypothetical protein PMIN06_012912 [Paraphaeosphaeria minitans]
MASRRLNQISTLLGNVVRDACTIDGGARRLSDRGARRHVGFDPSALAEAESSTQNSSQRVDDATLPSLWSREGKSMNQTRYPQVMHGCTSDHSDQLHLIIPI